MTADAPVVFRFAIEEPGEYEIVARASDPRGNAVASAIDFYAIGAGYTPWRMDQENRAELVPEKSVLRPGETARILVKSPWERATALVTVERAGVTATRIEDLRGSTPVLEIPIEPNLAALRLARAKGVTTIFNPATCPPRTAGGGLPFEQYLLP